MVNLITLNGTFSRLHCSSVSSYQFIVERLPRTHARCPEEHGLILLFQFFQIYLIIFLLVEYNWKAQFAIVVNAKSGQVTGINWYAIAMMILDLLFTSNYVHYL